MGRAPCCEKMGLKKGPWTGHEDLILVNFINQNGHGNWRALPKRAGLLRCGKSCRLRWMNYLRPDIKRGNFTREEEEMIVKLHQELGNRWSVIASRLPGRTDNEIKNVWHTHLKKRLNKKSNIEPESEPEPEARIYSSLEEDTNSERNSCMPSSSEVSSVTTTASAACTTAESYGNIPEGEMDENFWSEVLSEKDWSATSNILTGSSDSLLQFSNSLIGSYLNEDGGMDFWCNLFSTAEDVVKLPEF